MACQYHLSRERHCIVITGDNHDVITAEATKRLLEGQGVMIDFDSIRARDVAIDFRDGISDEIMDRMRFFGQGMAIDFTTLEVSPDEVMDRIDRINQHMAGLRAQPKRAPKPRKQKRLFRP